MARALAKAAAATETDDFDETRLAVMAFLADKPVATRNTYGAGIKQFFGLLGGKSMRRVTIADALAYKRWLQEREYEKNTICTRLTAVDSFFAWLTRPVGDDGRQIVTRNPFDFVSRSDVLPTPFAHAVPVAWDDFQKMLAALSDDVRGLRDRAVLVFLATTGRRRAEVARLRLGDLELATTPRSYRVVVKGGKVKHWELPEEAYEAMRAYWIKAGRLEKMRAESAVFGPVDVIDAGLDTERTLHPSAIWSVVKRAARKAGLRSRDVKTHGLRHMVAHDLDRSGARLQDIQRFLGHEWPNTTSGYLGKLEGPVSALTDSLQSVRKR